MNLIKKNTYFAAFASLWAIILFYLMIRHNVINAQGDPIEYIKGAQNLLGYDSAYHPPLFPATIALFNYFINDIFSAAKLIAFLSGVGVVILTYAIGIVCFKKSSIALIAAFSIGCLPLTINLTYTANSDILGAFLFLGSLFALMQCSEKNNLAILTSGALAGLAYLTRYAYIGIPIASILYFALFFPGSTKNRLILCSKFLISFLIVISPWSIICLMRHGDLHNWNAANIAFAMFDNTNWNNFHTFHEKYPSLSSLLFAHPILFLKHFSKNLLHLPKEIIIRDGLLLGFFSIPGVFLALIKPTKEVTLLYLFGCITLTLTLSTWLQPRFFLPIFPIIFLIGAYFVIHGLEHSLAFYCPNNSPILNFSKKIPFRTTIVVMSLLSSLLTALYFAPIQFRYYNADDEKQAGIFILNHTPKNTPVIASRPHLAWYAKRPFINLSKLQHTQPETLGSDLKNYTGSILVYTGRHSNNVAPQLEFLLDPSDPRIPDNLHLIFRLTGQWPLTAYRVGAKRKGDDSTNQ